MSRKEITKTGYALGIKFIQIGANEMTSTSLPLNKSTTQ
jgi:hypothetical protein